VEKFDKELFKKEVESSARKLYRRSLKDLSTKEAFFAVAYAVQDTIIDDWMATQKTTEKKDSKRVYYLSMEFLMGRALGNNIINLSCREGIQEALKELKLDLNTIENEEPDWALGNGGLGRLAACFLDSLATLGYWACGCGIRYKYGMFKQQIVDGYQKEVPDDWLKDGNPFELRRAELSKEVKFGGWVESVNENGKLRFVQKGYQSVIAIPYDTPVVGYNNHVVDTLRVWDAKAKDTFRLDEFDKGNYEAAVENENMAATSLRFFIRTTTTMQVRSFVSASSISLFPLLYRLRLRSMPTSMTVM
jgi:starch phosphorylase